MSLIIVSVVLAFIAGELVAMLFYRRALETERRCRLESDGKLAVVIKKSVKDEIDYERRIERLESQLKLVKTMYENSTGRDPAFIRQHEIDELNRMWRDE